MKKIAMPIDGNVICEHFGYAHYFKFYNLENQQILKEVLTKAPAHNPGLLPKWLVNENITDLVVAGIGHHAIEIFNQHKINVFVGVQLKSARDLINDYIEGRLETNGNLCDH